eukprot:CAMPEP_0118968996 /NCGR_PEP_ID=MMETSP1173-20130426/6148_1 /TAXON_ID=1034831 /ORGANISM="Rhizochromulina marina cf, Strain CCMP1243" /LENGTH=107 /DNA_ID=CAMNT_0006918181 /DNA_START=74 /DNA_END=394 /DNA_ORIENTATION=-
MALQAGVLPEYGFQGLASCLALLVGLAVVLGLRCWTRQPGPAEEQPFYWRQMEDEVEVRVMLPGFKGVSSKDVECAITESALELRVQERLVLKARTFSKAEPSKSYW